MTIITKPFWSALDASGEPKWVDLTINVVPSLLGFSLGGMAIMLAFSTGRFLEAIRQKGRDDSYFMKVIASFFHFTLVLGVALMLAIMSRAIPSIWLSGAGFFCSVYGVLLSVALIDHLWQTAMIFNKVTERDEP